MMTLVSWGNGRAELRAMPSERVVASGSYEAVRAAAKLLAPDDWKQETMFDIASREVREQVDREFIGDIDEHIAHQAQRRGPRWT